MAGSPNLLLMQGCADGNQMVDTLEAREPAMDVTQRAAMLTACAVAAACLQLSAGEPAQLP